MEFGSPVKKGTLYVASIQTTVPLKITYPSTTSGSHTTPPTSSIDYKQYISAIASLYESYSLKWFNKKIPAFFFVQHLANKWNHGSIDPYTSHPNFTGETINVHQVWRPERITIQPSLFEIEWVLENSEYKSYSPGTTLESEEIPYGDNQQYFVLKETPRSILHNKIRKAKLVAAIANLRVKQLYLKYYKRYGDFESDGKESPLSSDSEL